MRHFRRVIRVPLEPLKEDPKMSSLEPSFEYADPVAATEGLFVLYIHPSSGKSSITPSSNALSNTIPPISPNSSLSTREARTRLSLHSSPLSGRFVFATLGDLLLNPRIQCAIADE
ncbi:hypothetical protein CDAR_372581 [Caerostris darwini]|uniref:Uncharacterized protein n=1 Tax=Caerostris darwini TaxID=1538125 RepID=A0AAV4T5W5_9ARAC|nr:hypothetical protein CDAR_372581 [Caerostris darwini]